jgi:hypothetical protein
MPKISRHYTELISSIEMWLKDSRQIIGQFWGFKMVPEILILLLVSFQVKEYGSKIRDNLVASFEFSIWCPKFRDVYLSHLRYRNVVQRFETTYWSILRFQNGARNFDTFTCFISSKEIWLKDSRQLIGFFWGFEMVPEISIHLTGLLSNIEMLLKDSRQLSGLFWVFNMAPEISRLLPVSFLVKK